ncbi:hypothetical protein GS539_20940 [Rhodococcus hoagii]|nr:hypothetical protein [Prescottella equi]
MPRRVERDAQRNGAVGRPEDRPISTPVNPRGEQRVHRLQTTQRHFDLVLGHDTTTLDGERELHGITVHVQVDDALERTQRA